MSEPYSYENVVKSVLEAESNKLFFKTRLRLKFRDRVLAGLPKAGNPLDFFMNAKHMSDEQKEDFKSRVQSGTLTDDEKQVIKEMNWCTFERDRAGNLSLWHGNVKAMMREIFTTLGLTQRRANTKKPGGPAKKGKKGKKGQEAVADPIEAIQIETTETPLIPDKDPSSGGKQTFQHGVHVDPCHIPFERTIDGKQVYIVAKDRQAEPILVDAPVQDHMENGHVAEDVFYLDKVKHIRDASGTRSALGRHDMLDQPEMTIYLKWPARGVFSNEDMRKAWAACQEDGLGACRSQGFGKFDVIEWTILNDPTK